MNTLWNLENVIIHFHIGKWVKNIKQTALNFEQDIHVRLSVPGEREICGMGKGKENEKDRRKETALCHPQAILGLWDSDDTEAPSGSRQPVRKETYKGKHSAINTLISLLIALCRNTLSWFSCIRQKARNRVNTKSVNILLNVPDPSNVIGISPDYKKAMDCSTKWKHPRDKRYTHIYIYIYIYKDLYF